MSTSSQSPTSNVSLPRTSFHTIEATAFASLSGEQARQATHSQRGRMNPSMRHTIKLAINLHPAQYGTFAEINRSEVARWFFVGGRGHVARSIPPMIWR
jgi:hypothetical protein